jgi:hypothetical protein
MYCLIAVFHILAVSRIPCIAWWQYSMFFLAAVFHDLVIAIF